MRTTTSKSPQTCRLFLFILIRADVSLQRNRYSKNWFLLFPMPPTHPLAPPIPANGEQHVLHVLFPVQRFLRSCWKCCSLPWALYFILKMQKNQQ